MIVTRLPLLKNGFWRRDTKGNQIKDYALKQIFILFRWFKAQMNQSILRSLTVLTEIIPCLRGYYYKKSNMFYESRNNFQWWEQ